YGNGGPEPPGGNGRRHSGGPSPYHPYMVFPFHKTSLDACSIILILPHKPCFINMAYLFYPQTSCPLLYKSLTRIVIPSSFTATPPVMQAVRNASKRSRTSFCSAPFLLLVFIIPPGLHPLGRK